MKLLSNLIFLLFTSVVLAISCAGNQTERQNASPNPPDHTQWTELLQVHVDEQGLVNYQGFLKNEEKLNNYLNLLSNNAPDPKSWSREEQLAYWINAYNAFTIKLIVDNYPVESIKDLNPTISIPLVHTIWNKKFFSIGGEPTSLDEIEHGILRKQFKEPRIHFAVNCASVSCPPLRNEAYTADQLEMQLNEMAVRFINDPERNRIAKNQAKISKLFSWFTRDFTSNGTLIDFLNNYSKIKLEEDADIDYLPYDWGLNEQ